MDRVPVRNTKSVGNIIDGVADEVVDLIDGAIELGEDCYAQEHEQRDPPQQRPWCGPSFVGLKEAL